MARLGRHELTTALLRLGELALARGESIDLVVVGGVAMMLGFDARESTKDVDALIVAPLAATVRDLVDRVAQELSWPSDWLNDGAKGFVGIPSPGPRLLDGPGIMIRTVSIEQLLALKLCAWRDDVDIDDARLLLTRLRATRGDDASVDTVWPAVEPFLVPGREETARYALQDLWEATDGPS